MNAKTLKALNESIRHWERMRKNPHGEDRPHGEDCALCDLFFHKACSACPVRIATGQLYCYGTPYYQASAAWRDRLMITFKEYAGQEIDFLKSLRPKAKRK